MGAALLPNLFQIWTACKYVVYFYIGMKIRQKGFHFFEKLPVWLLVICDLLFFVASECLFGTEHIFLKCVKTGINLMLYVCGALLSWKLLQSLAGRFCWKKSKAFSLFSKYSMSIYLFHQQIIYFCIIMLNGRVNPYINAIANCIISIIVSIVIASLLYKCKFLCFLLGEKT